MYNGSVPGQKLKPVRQAIALIGGCAALWLAGCRPVPVPPTPTPTPPPTATPPPTVTPRPSPTPEPLAARVNGQPIRLADYQAELARCRTALHAGEAGQGTGTPPPDPCPGQALQALVDRALILQASQQAGLTVSEAQIEAEVQATLQAVGGEGRFAAWLEANGWTPATFREALRTELLAQALLEHIAGPSPSRAEQVHARHILVATEAEARDLLASLAGGADFAALAQAHSLDVTTRAQGGDLGWFVRGQLLAAPVEEAAFALQPGQISAIVRSSLGYHIVQVLERDPARPLGPGQQAALYRYRLESWLAEQRTQAQIERFVDTGS